MATPNFTAQKSRVYDLVSRLNSAFARATRNLYELESIGLFDLEMMGKIYNEVKETQAGVNVRLLQAMHDLEQADWSRSGKAARPE